MGTSPNLRLGAFNPLSPPVYAGINAQRGNVDYIYPSDVTLTANGTAQDVIVTDTDADSQLLAIYPSFYTSLQATILVNINGTYYMSQSPIYLGAIASDASAPVPILGKFIIPRGANINIAYQDFSGAGNTIQLVFRCMKLYGVS